MAAVKPAVKPAAVKPASVKPSTAKPSFDQSAKQRVLQLQQFMCQALRDKEYENALEYANQALLLQPDNAMTLQFAALLQEKVDMDDDDDEEEGEEEESPAAASAPEPEGEEDDDEEEDDEEDDDEEDDEDEDEPVGELPPPEYDVPSADSIGIAKASFNLPASQRNQIRARLAKDIEKLKMAQEAKRLIESDPLLSA